MISVDLTFLLDKFREDLGIIEYSEYFRIFELLQYIVSILNFFLRLFDNLFAAIFAPP